MLRQVFSFSGHPVLATKARVQFLDGSYDISVTLGRVFVLHLLYLCSIPVLPKMFLLTDPFWPRKIATDPYTLTDVNVVCWDDNVSEIKN
jgi:hypothetical protein